MATSESTTTVFCRINTLLDLMEKDVKERNSDDLNVIEALLPAVNSAVESLWELVEKEKVSA